MTITESEILDAIRATMQRGPEQSGITTAELSAALGCHPDRIRTALRRLIAQQLVKPGSGHRIALDGMARHVPVFHWVGKDKAP